MRTNPSPVPASQSFVGEVSFSKSDDYIRSLTALHVGVAPAPPFTLQNSQGDAQFFVAAANAIAETERNVTGSLLAISVQALCDEGPEEHPLNWLNVTERKKSEERRQCHEWYLTLESDCVRLTFEHGKFGYRKESFDRWSAGFARMAELLSGSCSWHQFGDAESRDTMLGKGQFYWQDPQKREPVPVDNFVFSAQDGWELTLAGVSHRCALSMSRGEESRFEWHDDYAQALLRMAGLLDGSLTYLEIGDEPPAEGTIPQTDAVDAPTLLPGAFVVKSIFTYGDVLPAPVLTYITGELQQARIITTSPGWAVCICNGGSQWRYRRFEQAQPADALRTLAAVLKGKIKWAEF